MNRRACAAHRQCRSDVRVRTWNAPAVCARPVRAMHRNLRRVSCGAYRQRSTDVHEQLELLHDLRAEDVVERGEHSEGERRGSYATASARLCIVPRAGDRAQRPHARRSSARRSRNKSICYIFVTDVAQCMLQDLGRGASGGSEFPKLALYKGSTQRTSLRDC